MSMDRDLSVRKVGRENANLQLDLYEELAEELGKRQPNAVRVRSLMIELGLEYSADTTICLERALSALGTN